MRLYRQAINSVIAFLVTSFAVEAIMFLAGRWYRPWFLISVGHIIILVAIRTRIPRR